MTDDLSAHLRSMPKVLLHEHLDGGLRPDTLFELLRQRGLTPPAEDPASLQRLFAQRAHAGSLVEYLKGFALTVAAMGSVDALERVAFEAAEDAAADGCVLAELRVAPTLFEPHVPAEAAVEALLAGLSRSDLPTGLILCAMRHHDPAASRRTAELAVRYRQPDHGALGVVGFDLAGPEHGHPPSVHAEAITMARDGGVGITLHAGEADEAGRVLEAARLGARRIGHGVRLADALDDPARAPLLDDVRAHDVHLELCVSSNVHTGAVPAVGEHPLGRLWRAGLSLSFHTDSRLVSDTTPTAEAGILVRELGLPLADVAAMTLQAARRSFLPPRHRAAAEGQLRAWAATAGVTLAA